MSDNKAKLEAIIAATLAESRKKEHDVVEEEVESLEETDEIVEDADEDEDTTEIEDNDESEESEEEVVEEEVEQLDELSRKTLDSYMKKAASSAKTHAAVAGKKGMNKNIAAAAAKVAGKRYAGLAAASGKIASAKEPPKKPRAKKGEGKAKAPAKKRKVKEEFMQYEETEAGSTLHPGARAISDPKSLNSKSLMMNDMVGLMAGMNKSDMLGFFNQVMSQYGPGKTYGVGDNSEQNKSTIQMKPSDANGSGPDVKMPMPKINAKEAVEEMFEGQELSEEFMDKASVIFEAAINAQLTLKFAELEEQYADAVALQLNEFTEDLVDKLDCYLDYVAENWMEENKVAIDSALTNELTQDFILGLKNLFNEHYIDVPEEKVNVIETLASKVESLEAKLDEVITENTEMKTIIEDATRKSVLEELASDLSLTQQEKFSSLAEGIEFDGDVDTYTKKLRIVKETYFKDKVKVSKQSNITEETFEGEEAPVVSSVMNRYAQALTRTTKI